MKRYLSVLLAVVAWAVLTPQRAHANDYMEHTENYTVYASGVDKIHFVIPMWVHGGWSERSYSALPGSHFSYKVGSDPEVKVLNWIAHVASDNDRDNDKGTIAVKFQPDQGQLYLTCMHNGVSRSVTGDGKWTDWLTVKQKPAGGYDRVTFLEFDWYPPSSLDGKDFKIIMNSQFDNFGEITDEYAYSFCAMDDYSTISCYEDHVNPDYNMTWTLSNTFRGKDQLVTPTLFDPYLYQMSQDGVAGYGYAAIPYSLANEPISYTLSIDTLVYSTKDLAGNIFIMTNDTLQQDITATFTVWRDTATQTIDHITSTKVDLKPYHRIYDFTAKEETDSTDTYTGANILSWTIKNPQLEDIVEGDYFEIVRATDTAFTDASSLAVLPMVVDTAGKYTYRDDDRSISTGRLEADSLTHPLVYSPADYYPLVNDTGRTMFLLKLQISTEKAVMPSLPVYYRIRRASSSVWGWHENFMAQQTVYKHNFLAPLASSQPQYKKDAEYETNHQVNFSVILKNEEVPTELPAKDAFEFSYTIEHSGGDDSIVVYTDLDTEKYPIPQGMAFGAALSVTKPNGEQDIVLMALTKPMQYKVVKNSTVEIVYLKSSGGGVMPNLGSKGFTADNHRHVHFDMKSSGDYINDVTVETFTPAEYNPDTYLTEALKKELKDTLYEHLKAEYEANPFGKCMWDKTANLILIRTIEETGKSVEIIVPSDSIHRLANGDWEATFSDVADKGCTHYHYSVRIDQSNADLHVREPETQLQPVALSGPDLYFDESAKIVEFTATQGDARNELKQGVMLTWKPSSSAVDEYILCRIKKGSSDAADTLYTGIETNYMDYSAVPNTRYEYTVITRYDCNGKSTSNSATTEGWRTPYGEISGSILMPDNSGMAGVKVDLFDIEDSVVVRSMTTDATGAYKFDSLEYFYTRYLPQDLKVVYGGFYTIGIDSVFIRVTDTLGTVLQDWTHMEAGTYPLMYGAKIEVMCTDTALHNTGEISSFVLSGNATLRCKVDKDLDPTAWPIATVDVFKVEFTKDGTTKKEDKVSRDFSVIPTSAYGQFSFNNTPVPTASVTLATDNAMVTGIDFANTNATRLTGRALYDKTTVPVAGAMFRLNGDTVRRGGAPLTTGTDGNFELQLTTGQPYTLQIFKPGHTFVKDGFFQKEEGTDTFSLDKPLDGIRFYDQTKVRLVGRVAGGNDQRDLPEGFGLGKNNLGDDLQLIFQLEGDNVAHFVYDPNDLSRDTVRQQLNHVVFSSDSSSSNQPVGTTNSVFEKKRIIVQPDPKTGEYEIDLFPVKYKVTQATAKGYATLFTDGAGNETFDLTNAPTTWIKDVYEEDTVYYNAVYDRIYRTPVRVVLKQNIYGLERAAYGEPEMEVSGANPNVKTKVALYTISDNNSVNYTLGYPVFYDNRKYQFKAKAYEAYYYNNDPANAVDIVPQRGGNVIIRNGMHSATDVERYPLNDKGENSAIWLTVDNVDVEHAGTNPMRSVSIALEDEGNVVETNVFSGFISGALVEQKSLRTTRGDVQLLDIVRDPGGAGSSTYVENGAEYTFSFVQSTKTEYGIKLSPTWGTNLEQYIGVYAGSPAGGSYIGELVNTQKAITFDIPISKKTDYGESYTYKLTTNNRIETSSESSPTGVGSPADVFFGTEVAHVIGKAKTISIIDDSLYQMCQPSFNAGTMLLLAQGTDTAGNAYYLVTGQKVYVSSQLTNTFTYSQYYIWNTIIPRLAMDRQDLLKNFPDAAAAQAYADATGKPAYWSYETGSYINDTIPEEAYQMFTPNNGEAYTDEVADLNNAIAKWLEILYNNEREKVEARMKGSPIGTYSVSAGNSFSHSDNYMYEYSYNELPQSLLGTLKKKGIGAISSLLSTAFKYGMAKWKGKIGTSAINAFLQSYDKVLETKFDDEGKTNTVAAKAGNMSFSMGFGVISDSNIELRQHTTAAISKSTGFNLVADPMGDITTSVYRAELDKTWRENSAAVLDAVNQSGSDELLYGSYVFFTEAGSTMCPHEEEELTVLYNPGSTLNNPTIWVAKPELTADRYEIANVQPDKRASLRINMFNQGQMDAGLAEGGQGFYLNLDGASNPDGAKVYVNGAPLIQPIYYWIAPGAPITQTIEVERGSVDDYDLSFSLYSEHCATTIASMNLGVHFLPLSTDVTIASPRQNWVMNTLSQRDSTGYYLPVTIDGFDIHHKNFDHIEFQYKLASESDEKWVNLCSFFANDSLYELATGNKAMIENGRIAPFRFYGERDPMEQKYDLRAVSFCRYGSGFVSKASPVISGIKDTRPPRVFGRPEPANSILSVDKNLSLRFNEPIAGNYLDEDKNFRIVGVTNETGITASTALQFDGSNQSYAATKTNRSLANHPITLEMFVKPTNADGNEVFFSHGDAGKGMQFGKTADNRLYVQIGNGMPVRSAQIADPMISFTRVLVTLDAEKGVRFYIGTLDITDENAPSVMEISNYAVSAPLIFGKGFNGSMLEARVWTKALTEEEIAATNDRYLTGYERELLAYYRMNEGKNESISDYAHGATLYLNGCTWNKKKGYSLYLNGKTAKLDGNLLGLSAIYDETIMFWFRTEGDGTLFSANRTEPTDSTTGIGTRIAVEQGNVLLYNGNNSWKASGDYADNTWHHFVLTINHTFDNAALYIDGSLYQSFPAVQLSGISGTMYLGGNGFVGNIDEFAIFEQALPRTLIESSDNMAFVGDEMGLMGYLPFEEQYLNPNGVLAQRFSVNDCREFKDANGNVIDKVVPLVLSAVTDEMQDDEQNAPVNDHGQLTKLRFDWSFNNDELMVNVLNQDYEINKQSIYITVRDVEDLNGNPMTSPMTWVAFVDRTPIKWSAKQVAIQVNDDPDDDEYVEQVRIVNNSGMRHSYTIESLPQWLNVDKSYGSIEPQGELTVKLYFNLQISVGSYSDIIYLVDENGLAEPLILEYNVVAVCPYDEPDKNMYQQNMSVCGQVMMDGSLDIDEKDLVIALYRNKCVGMTNIDFDNTTNSSKVFLTILGNAEMTGMGINFQLWQASTGKIFNLSPSTNITFSHSAVYGCGDETPVVFTTSGREIQTIAVNPGWSWISTNLNLRPEMATINAATMSSDQWQEGDLIKAPDTREFCTYSKSEDRFVGSLTGWDYKQIYMVYTAQGNTLRLNGGQLEEKNKSVTLNGDGQWSALPCLFNEETPISEALTDYFENASPSDLIKAHNRFAVFSQDQKWEGDLKTIRPGEGYLFRRMGKGSVTVHFYEQGNSETPQHAPSSKASSNEAGLFANPNAATNMTMIARVEGLDISTSRDLEVFVADEKAAVAEPITIGEETYYFLTIQSDKVGEPLRFEMDGESLTASETSGPTAKRSNNAVVYVPDSHHGSLKAPVLLTPSDERPYKVLENHHVVIIRNNEKYSITGTKL